MEWLILWAVWLLVWRPDMMEAWSEWRYMRAQKKILNDSDIIEQVLREKQ